MEIFYVDFEKFRIGNDELQKYSDGKTSPQHCLGRYIVYRVANEVYKIPNPELEIINNKPKFKFSDINFSISHSENIVMVAFDKNPVGVDIEYMRKRDFQKLGKRYNLNNPTKERFYEFWTRYEAEIKLQKSPEKLVTFPFKEKYTVSLAGNFTDYKIHEMSIENISCNQCP